MRMHVITDLWNYKIDPFFSVNHHSDRPFHQMWTPSYSCTQEDCWAIRMPAISRRPGLGHSSKSHSSPESTQASGSGIIPAHEIIIAAVCYPIHIYRNPNKCRHVVAQWGTMAYPRPGTREGGVSGTNPVWHQADDGSPLHGHSVKATPWDHLRCSHITSLDHSVQPNTRSAPPSGLGFDAESRLWLWAARLCPRAGWLFCQSGSAWWLAPV